jgi:dihydrofolate reductase
MRQLILIAQTSLDGFVAGANGSFENFMGGEENLGFVCSIVQDADATLMGRVSYQLLNSAWPYTASKPNATPNEITYSNWYNAADKIVLSNTLTSKELPGATVISNNLAEAIHKLKQQPGKNILIFGSPTAVHSLVEINAIDTFWLIVHPVLFGQGIPLFRDSEKTVTLVLDKSTPLSNGTLCNKYSLHK